jgi:hypothetical protein
MAGDGVRFKEKGYIVPKPFIEVKKDVSILDYTLQSIPNIQNDKIYFTIRTDWNYKAEDELKKKYPNCGFIYFDKLTRGNLDTAHMAISRLKCSEEESLMFLDSDNHYDGSYLMNQIKNYSGEFGVVCCFDPLDDNCKWGFAIPKDGKAVSFLEKDPKALLMGGLPMIGNFYFSSVKLFKVIADEILNSGVQVKNEFYMTQSMQKLIEKKIPVHIYKANKMVPLGTPDDFELVRG